MASDSGPVKSRPIASIPVEIESEILLLAGVTPKLLGQHRQDRLHAVEQGESRQSGGEERQGDAHKLRGTAFDELDRPRLGG